MRILPSTLVQGLSGKASGGVAQNNFVVRGFRKPSNPRSSTQSTVRQNFSTNSKGWSDLTDAQRASFEGIATTMHSTDTFGRKTQLKGKAAYSSINNNIAQGGGTVITTAPNNLNVVGPTSTSFGTLSATVATVVFAPSPVAANTVYVICVTKQQSAGTSRVGKSAYRKLSTVAAAGTTPANIFAAYVAKFGTPLTGKKVFLKIYGINLLTGGKSVPVYNVGTVA